MHKKKKKKKKKTYKIHVFPACILRAVCPMLAVQGLVCGLKRHLGDKNGDEALNPLHD